MNVAIIAAGGQGTRMGGSRAKQFLELAGVPIIIHTLRRFEQCAAIQEIIVVLPAPETPPFVALAGRYGLRKLARVVPGGTTRAESVWKGAQAIRSATAEIVAIHDGVRPLVTPAEIARTVEAARDFGAAVLTAPATDTIKEVRDGRIVRTLDRSAYRHALTPQCFRYPLLRRAYDEFPDLGPDVTDESALVERLGLDVMAVDGSARNIKITHRDDLAMAEVLLREFEEGGV